MASGLVEPFYRQLRLTTRWETLFPPMDPLQLAVTLEEIGYVVPERIVRSVGLGMNANVENGVIGRKGSIVVIADIARSFLGVGARDPESLVDAFLELDEFLLSRHNIDQAGITQFVELHAILTANVDEQPYDVWKHDAVKSALAKDLASILGQDVSPFGVRLASTGRHVNSINWVDIKIEPSIVSLAPHQYIEAIFRNKDREAVIAFATTFEQTVSNMLTRIHSVGE